MIVHPRDANTVLVAGMGHAFGPNAERGIFRTTDGGKTWRKVLYVDDKTGGIDVEFDPNNANIVFAAMYQVRRMPWTFESGGPGSGLYRSSDGGVTWSHIEGHGLPEGPIGRITVSVSAADSSRVYAMIEAEKGGLFRSDDGGATWELINDDQKYRQRAWYFSHIFADPKNADAVYALNTGMFRSTDAGKTFTLLPAPQPSRPLDRPHQSAAPHQWKRWRRDHQHRWRQDLEHAEQPTHRAVLSRGHGQSFPVLRLWRAAGQFLGGHRQLERHWRHHHAQLVRSGRRRKRLPRPRPSQRSDSLRGRSGRDALR
ncbi:hypothetical protein SBA3_3020023 [Candidatus Sulfopaludibacter sp. SbA3]|nr:hypothetical protein SBA3_3020023 [Candidatus Sulfopaludibacter sp. SbA3]